MTNQVVSIGTVATIKILQQPSHPAWIAMAIAKSPFYLKLLTVKPTQTRNLKL